MDSHLKREYVMRSLASDVTNTQQMLSQLWPDGAQGENRRFKFKGLSDEEWEFLYGVEDKLCEPLMSGQASDLLSVLLVAYSVRHGKKLCAKTKTDDAVFDMLYQAAVSSSLPDYRFQNVRELSNYLESSDKELYNRIYPSLVDRIIRFCPFLLKSPTAYPPQFVSKAIAGILNENDIQSVYNPYSGVCALAAAFNPAIECTAVDASGIWGILSLVLMDALGRNNVIPHTGEPYMWPEKQYDAVVSILPIDYRTDIDRRFQDETARELLQIHFLQELVEKHVASKLAIIVVHYDFCWSTHFKEVREMLCKKGLLKQVIMLPAGTFSNVKDRSMILVLDMAVRQSSVKFTDATNAIRANTPIRWTLADNDFNILDSVQENEKCEVLLPHIKSLGFALIPALYLAKVSPKEGEIIVRLGDICGFDAGDEDFKGPLPVLQKQHLCSRVTNAIKEPRLNSSIEKRPYFARIAGKRVVFSITSGGLLKCRKTNGTYFIEPDSYALVVKEEIVHSDYLIYKLLSSGDFARYISDITVSFRKANSRYILNAPLSIQPDLAEQYATVEDVLKEEEAITTNNTRYNVILGLKGSDSFVDHYAAALGKYALSVLAQTDGLGDMRGLIQEHIGKPKTNATSADAIIVDAQFESQGKIKTGLYAVLREYQRYVSEGKNVILCVLSQEDKRTLSKHLAEIFGEPESVLDGVIVGKWDTSEGVTAIFAALRHALEAQQSTDAAIRSQYAQEFAEADAIDEQHNWRISETLFRYIRGSHNNGELRAVAHHIIGFLQGKNVVPPRLDPGSVPALLVDRKYKDNNGNVYFQRKEVMPMSLSMSLQYALKYTNDVIHNSPVEEKHLESAVLNVLFELIHWFYEEQIVAGRFSIPVSGYYSSGNDFEFRTPYSGIVKVARIARKDYFYSGNVHLVPNNKVQLREGCKVHIGTMPKDENQPIVIDDNPIVFVAYDYEVE